MCFNDVGGNLGVTLGYLGAILGHLKGQARTEKRRKCAMQGFSAWDYVALFCAKNGPNIIWNCKENVDEMVMYRYFLSHHISYQSVWNKEGLEPCTNENTYMHTYTHARIINQIVNTVESLLNSHKLKKSPGIIHPSFRSGFIAQIVFWDLFWFKMDLLGNSLAAVL